MSNISESKTAKPIRNLPLQVLVSFLLIIVCQKAFAQSSEESDMKFVVTPIQVGDTIPEKLMHLPLQVVNHDQGKDTVTLNDYRGKKLIILDFWATWCIPCVAMFPKIDSLQQVFKGDLFVLGVTAQQKEDIKDFLEKRQHATGIQLALMSAVEDRVLHAFFPQSSLPHYVWIDSKGKVLTITGPEDITAENIQKVLIGEPVTFKGKAIGRVGFDLKKPFLFDETYLRGGKLLIQRSLTGFIEGVSGGSVQTIGLPDDSPYVGGSRYRRISARNLTIAQLYQKAYEDYHRHFRWENTELRVEEPDSLQAFKSGEAYLDWKRTGKAFCYELIVDKSLEHKARDIMKTDLEAYFPQYKAKVEKQIVSALCLIRTSGVDKIRSKGGVEQLEIGPYGGRINQYYLGIFLAHLHTVGLKKYKKPIIDLTNYGYPVDIEIEADISSIESVNSALAAYDLRLVEQKHEVEILVIEDATP